MGLGTAIQELEDDHRNVVPRRVDDVVEALEQDLCEHPEVDNLSSDSAFRQEAQGFRPVLVSGARSDAVPIDFRQWQSFRSGGRRGQHPKWETPQSQEGC